MNQKTERSSRNKIGLIVGISVIFFSIAGFFAFIMPALANGIDCTAPVGYQEVTSRMATDLNGNPIFIARGIVAPVEGTDNGEKITLPPCGSPDDTMHSKTAMLVVLDGKQVILASGSIGRDEKPTPLPEVPQP
ncbi:MAG: hypothetical protein UV71_C0012G0046 [Microgenomates group bacterium GW2011_GWC1_43_13]|uniref:Uncharacterized protein n=3 Tax=Candidatus Woeseibacteriota TaxID=1752722 RepID=A0A837I812_9BACT|nr:MAG: hypothetical protein UV71_C0012G0046 [Microgenomates group bacterium GW2011_GWC1_43_13]KKT33249.1 MAG: hypothetical protein UW20_C0004G0083 [Candidatus Woesebacteria bacterium GW2011_GWB1_44_11]KKT53687.1 MAG: hypothetical protein UW47_C0021G0009 [Candidatus Woesebacteria bacterium GW2011_GWA1_44_23]OGM76623.1 MAG: hypothetical protein A2208_01585 [Candidatus Woesebacteria bacterium RIFOXYA1_FULL_43_16]OGM84772.1 MAG: hypothetical protein A2421_00115 [Candidatus Woesebacteria bacterium 